MFTYRSGISLTSLKNYIMNERIESETESISGNSMPPKIVDWKLKQAPSKINTQSSLNRSNSMIDMSETKTCKDKLEKVTNLNYVGKGRFVHVPSKEVLEVKLRSSMTSSRSSLNRTNYRIESREAYRSVNLEQVEHNSHMHFANIPSSEMRRRNRPENGNTNQGFDGSDANSFETISLSSTISSDTQRQGETANHSLEPFNAREFLHYLNAMGEIVIDVPDDLPVAQNRYYIDFLKFNKYRIQ